MIYGGRVIYSLDLKFYSCKNILRNTWIRSSIQWRVLYPALFDQIGGGDRTIDKYLNIKY